MSKIVPLHNYLRGNTGDQNFTSLICCSAGNDSTALLFDRLENSHDHINVLHIRIQRADGIMAEYQEEAFDKIVAWAKDHCRPMQRIIKVDCAPPHIYDSPIMRASECDGYGARGRGTVGAVNDHEVVAVYSAWTARQIMAEKVLTGRVAQEDSTLRSRMSFQDADLCFNACTRSWPVAHETPFRNMLKAEVISQMPAELAALCVTCRWPERDDNGNWKVCNECHACARDSEARRSVIPLDTETLMRRYRRGTLFMEKYQE